MKKLSLFLVISLVSINVFGADQSREKQIKKLEMELSNTESFRKQMIKEGKPAGFSQEEYLEMYANIKQAKIDLQECLEEIKQRPS